MELLDVKDWPDWVLTAGRVACVGKPPPEADEDDGVLYLVIQQLENAKIAKCDEHSVLEQWCYVTLSEAVAAFVRWNGMPPGPDAWIRNVSSRGLFRRHGQTGEIYRSE